MKALLKQVVIFALVASAPAHARKTAPRAAGVARTDNRSANLRAPNTPAQSVAHAQAKPLPAPVRWRGLVGEYGPDDAVLYVLEKDGRLYALFKRVESEPLYFDELLDGPREFLGVL